MWLGLLLLFGSAFLSATILPGNSEVALGIFLQKWPHAWVVAIGVATIGNTMGGMTSWWLGRFLDSSKIKPAVVEKLQRYGVWLLLFSWVPLLGDALCVAAGWLRTRWLSTLIMLLIGKAIRYLLLVWLIKQLPL